MEMTPTESHIDRLFARWAAGEFDGYPGQPKWLVYPVVFEYMDRRRVTLTRICDIAAAHGFDPDVIRMRRHEHNATR